MTAAELKQLREDLRQVSFDVCDIIKSLCSITERLTADIEKPLPVLSIEKQEAQRKCK